MKVTKWFFVGISTAILGLAGLGVFDSRPVTAATTAVKSEGSSYKKSITVDFTTDGTYTWNLADLASLNSIDMTFKGGKAANTFTLRYIRTGLSHDLFTYTGTNYHTVVWYPDNSYNFQNGDQFVWSNSCAGKAVLVINANLF